MSDLKRLADFQNTFFKTVKDVGEGGKLISGKIQEELTSGKDVPAFLKTDFSVLIKEIGALAAAQNLLDGIGIELSNDFKKLFISRDCDEFVHNFSELVHVSRLTEVPDVLRGILHMEAGVALSFVTAIRNVPSLRMGDYEDSVRQYFFSKEGYKTVSGNSVMPPRLPIYSGVAGVREYARRIDGEGYLRDLTRIIAETTGDKVYDLKNRYARFKNQYQDDPKTRKLVDWFDSFGDLAEASVLPVIESALNGVSTLQLNPLVAAAVGTFCSVTVRKATEHSYLWLVEH
ncbi:hypothetical protein SAMN04489760_10168 [Syntrophus gentianae]|uniref:Uncharacterized protein n=1 Tax=Syntrophus gentianae TaxID=43775 RepID=A0A1H7UCI2_9BACT|nr:hypothetical protein [Syntrophus gentianae]SEL93977.1 hypothetical protein SAMN04489760_10168 [Syntrophus gentianae]